MASVERFAERMRYWCDEGNLGYDQSNRWDIRFGGECDCSSLVIHCLREAGFDTGDASYTGDMSANLTARGWKRIPASSAKKVGDILLNDANHVAVVTGPNRMSYASIDERGRISGGQAGDQTDRETRTVSGFAYSRGWNCMLRYEGGESSAVDEPEAGAAVHPPIIVPPALVVDGWWGMSTTAAMQKTLSTPVDGYVDGQDEALARCNRGGLLPESWKRGLGGSPMVRALQTKVGSVVDGLMGPNTVAAMQRHLGCEVDGYVDGPSPMVRELQRRLNAGTF